MYVKGVKRQKKFKKKKKKNLRKIWRERKSGEKWDIGIPSGVALEVRANVIHVIHVIHVSQVGT